MTATRSPYGRGLDAAHRVGEYRDWVETPECPYPAGSVDAKAWQDGFGAGVQSVTCWSLMG